MHLNVGVTGHRDLVAGELDGIRARVRELFETLAEQYPMLPLRLLTPLAEGADRLVTEVARELGIPYIAVLPMSQSLYEADFADPDSRAILQRQIDEAETVITLPPHDGGDPVYLQTPGPMRDHQYKQAGVFVSNHCQVLLAIWDGKSARHAGGTADVLHYHLTGFMGGGHEGDESPNVLADNENDLAYHVAASRDRPDGGLADGLKPGDAHWVTAHFEREPGEGMPHDYRQMLDRLVTFENDRARYQPQIAAEGATLFDSAPELEVPPGVAGVDELFSVADWLAIHFRRRVSLGLFATHAIAVLMGLSFIIYSEFGGSDGLVWAFLLLFFGGLVIYKLGERREWHRKYLDYRALAEGLRVQFYWTLAGVVDSGSTVFAYDNFLQKQDVELGWIRHVMRSASLHQDRHHEPDRRWLEWVVEHWVGQPNASAGQVAYYRDKARLKSQTHQRTETFGNLCLWAGIALALVLVLLSDRVSDDGKAWLMLLMGALPLIAAVRSAYSHTKADKELIKQYVFMARVFGNAERLLDRTPDPRGRRRILRALGTAALEEHAEWILMHRERPLEHSRL